jgi:hypothetical protein
MSLADKLSKPMSVCAITILGASATPAVADSLSRSVDVNGTPSQVWSKIGPFSAIKDWHPAIGSCTEDGKSPPTRTLVTKDGKATFVETQLARSDKRHFYTYTFVSSPLPVKEYAATIRVTAKGNDLSTVTWSGEYKPAPGAEIAAKDALSGIYESGLNSIKAMFEKRVAE